MTQRSTERTPVAVRFWAKVDKNGPVPAHRAELGRCWLWTGATHGSRRNAKGGPGRYGKIQIRRRIITSHIWAYEQVYGPVPKGLTLDHLCRAGLCVRPSHLEAVTQAENNRRNPRNGKRALPAAQAAA